MEREYEYILEQSRTDKIKSLGFLCYNLYVDGVIVFPDMNEIVEDIRTALNNLLVLRQSNAGTDYMQIQESNLNEKLTELGCICYNLYVDSKLFNNEILALCDSISSINHEIANGLSPLEQGSYDYLYENHEPLRAESAHKNKTGSKLKVTCPYGMEPIPTDFKRCRCGYRNKHEAQYCGKCGAKLS